MMKLVLACSLACSMLLFPTQVVSDSAEVIASGDRVQVQGDQGSREPTLPSVPALPGDGNAPTGSLSDTVFTVAAPGAPPTVENTPKQGARRFSPAFNVVTRIAVLYWRQVCNDLNSGDYSAEVNGEVLAPENPGPAYGTRAYAIIYTAMYDALASLMGEPTYLTYNVPSFSTNHTARLAWSAVAQAAHDTGASLYPRQAGTLQDALGSFSRRWPLSEEGVQWGAAVAKALLQHRSSDKAGPASEAFQMFHAPPFGAYEHGPDPINNKPETMYAPNWGSVSPWFLSNLHDPTMALPDPKTVHYAADYNVTKMLGKNESVTRTEDERNIGVFWAYDGHFGIGTPPRLFQQVVDAIVTKLRRGRNCKKVNSGLKLLRLYGAVSGAMADACISGWYEKYKWGFWRPVVGIRFPESVDGTEPDPEWRPFGTPVSGVKPNPGDIPLEPISSSGRTPPFPAYPSGHAIMGTAVLRAAATVLQLPDTFTFSLVSDELNGETKDQSGMTRPRLPRTFTIKEAIEENKLSRVYLGVHWMMDVEEGSKTGAVIGNAVGAAFPKRV